MSVGNSMVARRGVRVGAASVLAVILALPMALGPAGRAAAGVPNAPRVAEACDVLTPVLVVGGTPSGVAAALAAARTGTAVYMTESRPYLGGDLTGAML